MRKQLKMKNEALMEDTRKQIMNHENIIIIILTHKI
jgi:hypothetical protein